MRGLSEVFMRELKIGYLSDLTNKVVMDRDLDLQIRENYINIYYKGNSLLKLDELNRISEYRVTIHPKFLKNLVIPLKLYDLESTTKFIKAIPYLKENIIQFGRSSLEVEYEQMIIRANNYEPRNNSEYFIVDRQYMSSGIGRFDLTGFYWDRSHRTKYQTVPIALIEIKFALNTDIQDVHNQLQRYYDAIACNQSGFAEEAEVIFKQKLDLGLFKQDENRLKAMKTLKFSKHIDDYQFILILVDYNPYSLHLHKEKLFCLPFASQIRIFHAGFAMWEKQFEKFTE